MFIINQILFLLITIFSAKSEQYATYPYRVGDVPHGKENGLFHKWGAAMMFTIQTAMAFGFGKGYLEYGLLFLLNGFIYWMLFDALYSLFIGQKWYYLGTTAATDITLKKIFGKNAGKGKFLTCLILIIFLNILKYIL